MIRRVVVPFLAAAIWLAIAVGTMAAAKAGGPLYPTRLWLESVTVPATGGARVESDLQRLDDRIAEALGAANSGDRGAVAAALEAYGDIARDATASSAEDATLMDRVERALARHQAVLAALAAGLDDHGDGTAADAIERNLARVIESNAAVLEILGRQHGADGPNAAKPGTTSGAETGGTGGTGTSGTTSGGTAGGGGPAVTATSTPGAPTDAAGGGNEGGGVNGVGAGGAGAGGGSNGGGPTKTEEPATPEPIAPDHSPRNGG